MKKILIVEDDKALATGIGIALEKEGYHISYSNTLWDAKTKLIKEVFQLIILDWNLPDGEGCEFCKNYCKEGNTPIIMLTARDTEQDEIEGINAGAEDYITKPFSIGVLRARVNRIMYKHLDVNQYDIGECYFDFEKRIYTRAGRELHLSKVEQKLLKMLVANKEQVLTREQIIMKVWDTEDSVDENTLSVTVGRLRNKIGNGYINTVYGIGYCFKIPRG